MLWLPHDEDESAHIGVVKRYLANRDGKYLGAAIVGGRCVIHQYPVYQPMEMLGVDVIVLQADVAVPAVARYLHAAVLIVPPVISPDAEARLRQSEEYVGTVE